MRAKSMVSVCGIAHRNAAVKGDRYGRVGEGNEGASFL